jgi:hypothetical protein
MKTINIPPEHNEILRHINSKMNCHASPKQLEQWHKLSWEEKYAKYLKGIVRIWEKHIPECIGEII